MLRVLGLVCVGLLVFGGAVQAQEADGFKVEKKLSASKTFTGNPPQVAAFYAKVKSVMEGSGSESMSDGTTAEKSEIYESESGAFVTFTFKSRNGKPVAVEVVLEGTEKFVQGARKMLATK
jgi:hypothetical protein